MKKDIPHKLIYLYLEYSREYLEKAKQGNQYHEAIRFQSEVNLLEQLLIASGNPVE